jgi:hypothetical protein
MATSKTIKEVLSMLFLSPLANKPKNLPGQTDVEMMAATAKIYAMTLADLDDNLLMAAVVQYLASGSKWFPAPVDLRTTALSLVNRADGTPSAFEAWAEVKRAIRSREPLSPMAQRAIDLLGGLAEFGASDIGDESSWRARFIQAYEQLQQRQAEDAMMLPAVAGYIQARKELGGQSVAGLIGEAAKSLAMPGKNHDKNKDSE